MPKGFLINAELLAAIRDLIRKEAGRIRSGGDRSPAGRRRYHHTKEGKLKEDVEPGGEATLEVYVNKPKSDGSGEFEWVKTDPLQELTVKWPEDEGFNYPADVYARAIWINGEWRLATGKGTEFFPAALLDREGERYSFVEMEPYSGGWQVKEKGQCGVLNAAQMNYQKHNCQAGNWPEIVWMWKDLGNSEGSQGDNAGAGYRDVSESEQAEHCELDTDYAWPGFDAEFYFEYSVGPNEEDDERYEYKIGDDWDRNNAPELSSGEKAKGVKFQVVALGD